MIRIPFINSEEYSICEKTHWLITSLYFPVEQNTAWLRVTVVEIEKVESYLEENLFRDEWLGSGWSGKRKNQQWLLDILLEKLVQ